MKTRLIGATVALILAVAGTVVVGAYIAGAERRAYAGTETSEILVIDAPVPEGTAAAKIADLVRVEAVPTKVIAADSVTSLGEIAGKVAATDLVPGEQLLSSRFLTPEELQEAAEVPVPRGMQELTVRLAPERVVGGTLEAGERTGVYVSVEGEPGETTHRFHAVLVTNVQGAVTPPPGDAAAPAPEGELLVTLAVTATDAEDIVWASEFGRLWLSREAEKASDRDTKVTTRKDVLR